MELGRPSDLTILTRLAVGGMAEIFLARRGPGLPTTRDAPGEGQLVVVKRILPQYAEEGRFLRMLFDEASISSQLVHPNIVKVFGLTRGGEAGYSLIMEYVAGETVARLLRACRAARRGIPHPISAYVAEQVAGALHYAHSLTDGRGMHLGLVHRDITPGNIMLGDDGSIKVLDFGIARAHGRFDKTASSDIRKGTLGYMAPEYYRNGTLDRRCDVFSLGVVLYEMLTMTHPFEAPNEMAMVQRVLRGDKHPLKSLAPDIHPKLAEAVEGALVLDPDKRFQTAADMQKALQAYLQALKTPPTRDDLVALQKELFAPQIEARRKLKDLPPPAVNAPDRLIAPERVSANAVEVMGGERPADESDSLRSESLATAQITSSKHYIPDADETFEDATVVQDSSGLSHLAFLRGSDLSSSGEVSGQRPSDPQLGQSQKIVIDEGLLPIESTSSVSGVSGVSGAPQKRRGTPPRRKRGKYRQVLVAVAVGGAVVVVGLLVLLLLR